MHWVDATTLRQAMKGAVLALGLAAAGAAHADDRHAALVVDGNNGAVLHADQADELRHPASLTKMMTIYLAFESIERGRTSYSTRLKVSQEAASAAPTKLDLDPGETIAMIDAIKALITKSANDAAIVIAEHLGGTEANFAQMMTAKARLFGMSRTTFRNASGLPDPAQVTTARDMVRLALRLQDDFPVHYQLFSTRAFTYDGSTYRNHNNLLYRFQGTDGIKTGYVRASGFNLVSSVRRGGRHVVGAIFGGATASRRDDAMQLLLSRALMRSSPYKTRLPSPVLVAAAAPVRRPPAVQTAAAMQAPAPVVAPRPRPVMVPQRPRQETIVAAAAPTPVSVSLTVPSPVAALRPPSPVDGAASMRGTQPSTLAQQAMTLARASGPAEPQRQMTPPYAVRGPAVGSQPVATLQNVSQVGGSGGYEIQIGAYASAAEADRALLAARGAAQDLLAKSAARAIAAQKDARQIYRARFVGFDSRVAATTCQELRRRQIDCFVMRAE